MIFNFKAFLESGQIDIDNMDVYVQRMDIGFLDKLFFINKIKPDALVDFGCADGFMLSKLSEMDHDINLIGYDDSDEMIKLAKSKLGSNATLSTDWSVIKNEVNKYSRPAILLSSVIHEVYSYSDNSSIEEFWNRTFGGDFKYIIIRDMLPKKSIDTNRKFEEDVIKVKESSDPQMIESFEDIWGPLESSYRQFVHYLLKYKYVENWHREVNENYLPISVEDVLKKIPSNYRIIYNESYLLPHFQNQLKNDFGIEINETTHTKLIIKRIS